MANLINSVDLRANWSLSVNMDANRVDPHIVRAQENQFKTLLSAELYFALKSATIVPGDRFDKLMKGEAYKYGTNFDIEWEGGNKLLCAYAYALLLDANPVHITRGGNVSKETEESQKLEAKQNSLYTQAAYGEAIRLEGEFFKWISQRNNVYPEYFGGRPAKGATQNFFNASRGRVRYEKF